MKDDDHLKRINALTSNARQTWFALLAALVFVGITLMGVEHIDFYGVDRATTLPLVNVEVPTRLFFIAAPILIAAIYGYFHLYLIRLFDALGAAPIRVNKIRLGDAVAPWLVTDAAMDFRSEHRGDHSTRPRVLDRSSRYLNFLLVWVFGLILLGLLWWQALPARDFTISFAATLSFVVSFFTGYESLRARGVRLSERDQSISPKRVLQRQPLPIVIAIWAVLLAGSGGVAYVFTDYRHVVALNLSGENIVDRPAGWLPHAIAREEFLASWCKRTGAPCQIFNMEPAQRAAFEAEWEQRRKITLSDLRKPAWHKPHPNPADMDFRGARMDSSFLPGTNLSKARMQNANLNGAQMEAVFLDNAQMQETVLSFADLSDAVLSGAELEGAVLSGTRLEGATMIRTQMPGVNLTDAQLDGADLRTANLQGADLTEAQLAESDLGGAFLSGANLTRAQLPNARLVEAQIDRANFLRANMNGVDLTGAQMDGTNLKAALMEGARLVKARVMQANLMGTRLEGANLNYSSIAGDAENRSNLTLTNLMKSKNNGGMIRSADLRSVQFDDKTDFRNVFLDRSVSLPASFRDQMGQPCQWSDQFLDDAAFYGRWRGWIDAAPPDFAPPDWADLAPAGFEDVTPIPPPVGCRWKFGPMRRLPAE
ncbi:MAG: pentapeptide repeat-containing protein [Pseudomonadota bacterium]